MRSGRVPIWQKPKMYFYVMDAQLFEEMSIGTEYVDGEIDIHKLPVQEVEVRQKDLLPLLHGSHGIHPEDPTISHLTAKHNDGFNLAERTATITLSLDENYVMNSTTPIHGEETSAGGN